MPGFAPGTSVTVTLTGPTLVAANGAAVDLGSGATMSVPGTIVRRVVGGDGSEWYEVRLNMSLGGQTDFHVPAGWIA